MRFNSQLHLSTSGDPLLDLGPLPVSNRFLNPDSADSSPEYPFSLRLRGDFGLIHMEKPFPVEELKPKYQWLTCFEPEDHLDRMAQRLIQLPGISKDSVFGAYSFKDDSTLRRLEGLGYGHTWRLVPSEDFGITDPYANVESFQHVFTLELAIKAAERHGLADVLIVRHVVEHAYDISGFMKAVHALVKPEGYIVWELPDCERALAAGDCTTLWEEHVFYFTTFTFRALLEATGAEIIHYESEAYPFENSIVAIVKALRSLPPRSEWPASSVKAETNRARSFANSVISSKARVRTLLERFTRQHGKIALFGAGHLSVAFLSIMEVADLISCVIDDNPHKKGMKMPVGNLPIMGSESLKADAFPLCLLSLNPANQPAVIQKNKAYTAQGGRFSSIFPGTALYLEEAIS